MTSLSPLAVHGPVHFGILPAAVHDCCHWAIPSPSDSRIGPKNSQGMGPPRWECDVEPQRRTRRPLRQAPRVLAEINVAFDVAMPTCEAPGPLALKNTRSPAWMFARLTGTPTPNCEKLVRGSVTPACRKA